MHWLCVLVGMWLMGQQVALVHPFSHTPQHSAQTLNDDGEQAVHAPCLLCVSISQLAQALPGASVTPHPTPTPATGWGVGQALAAVLIHPCTPCARGPPVLH